MDHCQTGQLGLQPDSSTRGHENRCTSTLIWPAGEDPTSRNTLIVDPGFTQNGALEALHWLERLKLGVSRIGHVFSTHSHTDHLPPPNSDFDRKPGAVVGGDGPFAGLLLTPCPGHSPDLNALLLSDPSAGEVWLVGDAILNEDWLRSWAFYWPNLYTDSEIIQTWRSVAKIIARADLIIPGHGTPIGVTPELLVGLLDTFPSAPLSDQCPDVRETLQTRLHSLCSE